MSEDLYDSDNSDNEERREYFYDLVYRAPEVEEVIPQLRDHSIMSVWKENLKCLELLSHHEINSLLDPNVVDWYDFHTSYLVSISNRRATSKTGASDKSHAQIDDLFSLSDQLQKDHPEFIVNSSSHKKNKWQSHVAVLVMMYQQIVNNNICRGAADLPTRVRDILRQPWKPSDKTHEETIYYVAGAVANMIQNLAKTSKEVYAVALHDIQKNAITTKADARAALLPSGKVETKEMYHLCYPNQAFYDFVNKIESVFDTLLSERNLAFYGAEIIADITHALSKESLGIEKFFSRSYDDSIKHEVLRRIIWSYGRLRGKDFVRKCNAKVGAKHHETHRSALGTAAAIASKNAKSGKSDKSEEGGTSNPRYQYLIKQKKNELVGMCKARDLHYSGTKTLLLSRIMDYDSHESNSGSTTTAASVGTTAASVGTEGLDDYYQEVLDDMEREENALIETFPDYFPHDE